MKESKKKQPINSKICGGVALILDNKGQIKNDANLYKTETIAQLFGLSVRRIQQLTADGIIKATTTTQGRRYDLVPTIRSYIKYLSDKANGKLPKNDKEAELKEQKLMADIALKESQNELHKLKTQIIEGKYIKTEKIEKDYRGFFMVFKKFAISIPSRVTGYINGYIPPTQVRSIENELNKEITNLLNSFVVAGIASEEEKK